MGCLKVSVNPINQVKVSRKQILKNGDEEREQLAKEIPKKRIVVAPKSVYSSSYTTKTNSSIRVNESSLRTQIEKGKNLMRQLNMLLMSLKVGKLLVTQKRKLSSPYLGKNNWDGLAPTGSLRFAESAWRRADPTAATAEEIHGLQKMVKLLLLRSEPEMRPEEVEALLLDAQHSPVDANSAHGSTHAPNMGVDNVGDIHED
ncbi:hypothetical protein PIB30_066606 [Stylosanthes scabra]|uniref:Uncharacterized protein n=1 Tax=Stylosanthes scabra TaxID=79078 RepID=A0ABU6ZL29_9FABA|nr:hypothetical protein [Stylosanthes scabra]